MKVLVPSPAVLLENNSYYDGNNIGNPKSTTITAIHSMEVDDSNNPTILPTNTSSDQPPPPKTSSDNGGGTRKRRMSKKERKLALKKRKKLNSVKPNDAKKGDIAENNDADAVTATATEGQIVQSVVEPTANNKESIRPVLPKVSTTAIIATKTTTTEPTEQKTPISPPQSSLLRLHEEEEIRFELEYLKSYIPIPLPTVPSPDVIPNNNNNYQEDGKKKKSGENGKTTLGKWFPNALLVKCPVNYTNTGKLLLRGSARRTNDNNNKKTSTISTNNDSKNIVTKQQQSKTTTTTNNNPRSSLLLFYQYINANNNKQGKWSQTQLQLLMTYLSTVAKQRHIGGRIRVAQEGVNVTVSAVDILQENSVGGDGDGTVVGTTAKESLRHFVRDLQNFDPGVFASDATDFKYIDNLPPDRHFKELKVMPVQELVFYGVKEEDKWMEKQQQRGGQQRRNDKRQDGKNSAGTSTGGVGGGVHLDADEFDKMLQQSNTVVIDVRNHYETVLGRFDGQSINKNTESHDYGDNEASHTTTTTAGQSQEPPNNTNNTNNGTSGAEYMDPLMRKSTDFPSWLAKDETKKRLRDKTVLMYCTGGIRCERASSYLKERMGDEVNGVYQLRGGVERYLKAFPDGGLWRGKNFVFDKREAVGVGNLDGDGGVIQKKKKQKKKNKNSEMQQQLEDLPSRCCVCNNRWDRYVGKKKCYTCGVPVLMCDACMSTKPDKTKGKELSVRCPLCVSENVTVPASEVEFTANGIRGTVIAATATTSISKKQEGNEGMNKGSDGSLDATIVPREEVNSVVEVVQERKAADSVLKWGGGHATKKKDARQKKKDAQQMKRRLCQYGSECFRKDCFFAHPERQVMDVWKKLKTAT